jgi:hypothetical protein
MDFKSAWCTVCRRPYFDRDEVICYRLTRGGPEPVSLGGREPWSGVFSVCRPCISFLAREGILSGNRIPDGPAVDGIG